MMRTLLGILAVLSMAADWPAWRGPTADGLAPDDANPPLTWSEQDNIRWKVTVPGVGNSSPIVTEGQIIVTASSGRDDSRLHVISYDFHTGTKIWQADLFGSPAPAPFTMFPPLRGHAASTATTDGKRIVALFGTGDLVCLDLRGQPLWIRSLSQDYGTIRNDYGLAASPVLHGDRVIVQVDHLEGSYVLSINAVTGRTQWKTTRPMAYDNWSTPVIVRANGEEQIVCLGTGQVTGYDLATGVKRWHVEGLERLCSTTPIVRGSIVYVTSGPSGINLRLDVSQNPPRIDWKSKRTGPFIPSAIEVNGLYFQPDDQGSVICYDSQSGQELWKERLFSGRSRPSPVAAADRVYFTALDGTTVVIKASREFEELARNKLGEEVAASPAVVGRSLLFRSSNSLIHISH